MSTDVYSTETSTRASLAGKILGSRGSNFSESSSKNTGSSQNDSLPSPVSRLGVPKRKTFARYFSNYQVGGASHRTSSKRPCWLTWSPGAPSQAIPGPLGGRWHQGHRTG